MRLLDKRLENFGVSGCIPPILLYNLHTAGYTPKSLELLDSLHRKHLRSILRLGPNHRLRNTDVYYMTNTCPMSKLVLERRWDLLGHILRRDSSIPANIAMKSYYNHRDTETSRSGNPSTSLPVVLHREITAATNHTGRPLSLDSSRHYKTLRRKAQYNHITGLDNWHNLKQTVIDTYAERRKTRIESAALSRSSIRLRNIQEASPNTRLQLLQEKEKYSINTVLKPPDVLTPLFQDFRNFGIAILPSPINEALNMDLD